LNHPAQEVYADKILSFQIAVLFVSMGEGERTASKGEFVNGRILTVYLVQNRIHDKIPLNFNENCIDVMMTGVQWELWFI
jgi:hypothetical protein